MTEVVTAPATLEMTLAKLRFDGEVVAWERAFRSAGIAHVFLKGVGFDEWLDRSDSRVGRDIDVLCPRSSIPRARRLLRESGFRCVVTEPVATTWVADHTRLPVDLHDSIKGTSAHPDTVWDEISQCVVMLDIAGIAVPVLGSPARELVVGLHVVSSGEDNQRALADFQRALERTDLEEWKQAEQFAESLSSRSLFNAAFSTSDQARSVGEQLGIEAVVTWRRKPGPGSDDALALLPVLRAQGTSERVRLAARFLRIHPLAMSRLRGRVTTGEDSREDILKVVRTQLGFLPRLHAAVWDAWRLNRSLEDGSAGES
jgi:hypothetical protein